jgi:hypothetical protein
MPVYILDMLELPTEIKSAFEKGEFSIRQTSGSLNGIWSEMGTETNIVGECFSLSVSIIFLGWRECFSLSASIIFLGWSVAGTCNTCLVVHCTILADSEKLSNLEK